MELIKIAKEHGADLVGFAPAGRFDKNDPIFKIFPGTKTVIGLAFRVSWGLAKVFAVILFVLAVPVLIGGLLVASGIVLLFPLVLIGIAWGILKTCV